jgi:hypothetical protein
MTSPDETARAALISRIHKLRALAECAGATEAEALAAAAKMAQLIAEHNVAATELTLRRDAQGCIIDFLYIAQGEKSNWQHIHGPIARLFKVKSFRSREKADLLGLGILESVVTIHFFGFPEDVAAAKAMMKLMELACIREITAWCKKPRGKTLRPDFETGLYARLRERIEAMVPPPAASTSRSLMVLKDQLVSNEWAQWLKDHDMTIRKGRNGGRQIDERAFSHGQAAADRVDLGQRRTTHSVHRPTDAHRPAGNSTTFLTHRSPQ